MISATTNRARDGFSLITAPGRTPMTRRQANDLGRLLGTVPPARSDKVA